MRRPDVRSPGTDRSSTASSPSRSGAASAEHGFPDEAPAGTGYLTVAVLTISAILTAIMTLRTHKEARMMRLHRTSLNRHRRAGHNLWR